MGEIIQTILISVLSSSMVAALISQFFARKNLKTSQYIDVITSERIKWIGNVRDDITILVSSVIIHIRNAYRIDPDFIESQKEDYKKIDEGLKSILSKSEIVTKAILLKLKLNPVEDGDIILLLDEIILLFTPIAYNIADSSGVDSEKLISLCQAMLKREWEKVKDETREK